MKIKSMFFVLFFCCALFFPASGQEYDQFVGLGRFCQTRHQIISYLEEKYQLTTDQAKKSFCGAHLFDWTVIYDYRKLSELLDGNLHELLERRFLKVTNSWGNEGHVENEKYRVGFNHMFSRKQNSKEIDIDEQYESAKSKVDYLTQKFVGLRDFSTLYIMSHVSFDGAVMQLLHESLCRLRGNDRFGILVINNAVTIDRPLVYQDRWFFATVLPGKTWQGDKNSWFLVLDQFVIKKPRCLEFLHDPRNENADRWHD